MTRLNIVILIAVLVSALYLVRTQYESRRLFTELDRAVAQAHGLEIEHERLQAEKRGQATPLRVERLAKDQLQMRPASPGITQYVALNGSPMASAPAAPAFLPAAPARGTKAAGVRP